MRPAIRSAVALAAFGLMVFAAPGPVTAQVPGGRGGAGPTYSPYLNLLRPNAPLYQNYYGLVRPEVEFRGSIGGLQQQANQNAQALGQLEAGAGQVTTGHQVGFLTHNSYFMTIGGFGRQAIGLGGGIGGRLGGAGRAGVGAGGAGGFAGGTATGVLPGAARR